MFSCMVPSFWKTQFNICVVTRLLVKPHMESITSPIPSKTNSYTVLHSGYVTWCLIILCVSQMVWTDQKHTFLILCISFIPQSWHLLYSYTSQWYGGIVRGGSTPLFDNCNLAQWRLCLRHILPFVTMWVSPSWFRALLNREELMTIAH